MLTSPIIWTSAKMHCSKSTDMYFRKKARLPKNEPAFIKNTVNENATCASLFHLLVCLSGGKTHSQVNTHRLVFNGIN